MMTDEKSHNKLTTTPQVQGSDIEVDDNLVTWDGPKDPTNPLNWSQPAKWTLTILISIFGFITLMSSTMVAPALPQIAADLKIKSAVTAQAAFSSFILWYGVGPLLWGPLAEQFGRVRVLLIASSMFLVFNALCAVSQNAGMLVATRCLSGFASSASVAVSAGILSDCWRPSERGKSIAIAVSIPLLGPAIGPITAAALLERVSWRWVFGITDLIAVPVVIIGVLFLRESYAPVILARRAAALRKSTGNLCLYTPYEPAPTLEPSDPSRKHSLRLPPNFGTNSLRAIRLLIHEPIIATLSAYNFLFFGILYLFIAIYPDIFTSTYHQSVGIAGLNYLSYGIGLIIGTQICARGSDYVFARLKARRAKSHAGEETTAPGSEFRIVLMAPFTLLVPGSLLLLGLPPTYHASSVLPNLGAFLLAIGYIVPAQLVTGYICDTYPRYSASANGAVNVPRSFAAFGFPLFAPTLFQSLGYGWGFGVLAILTGVLGLPGVVGIWGLARWLRGTGRLGGWEEVR